MRVVALVSYGLWVFWDVMSVLIRYRFCLIVILDLD